MCDEWMPAIKLLMSLDEFFRLPRNPAYRYEYIKGHALLSPRPKFHHARLDLARFLGAMPAETLPSHTLRAYEDSDFEPLVSVFCGAFHDTQPYGSLSDDDRAKASRASLMKTVVGGDGPWLRRASFVTESVDERGLSGGIFLTLLPGGDPKISSSYHWTEPRPDLSPGDGQPHLTWVFASHWFRAEGIGTALLQRAARELLDMGYRDLWTTFIDGNSASMLWHWSCGFELLAGPASKRAMRRRWENIRAGLEMENRS